MQVADGVHHFDTDPFNWYVIEEAGRLAVVDGGFPAHYSVLKRGLATIGRSVADVAAVLVTHAHADHTGFVQKLAAESQAPVYLHSADVALARRPLYLPWGGLLSNAWRGWGRHILMYATTHGLLSMGRVTKSQPMSDGQELDVPGRPIVMHTPGHTPGSVALLLPARRVLLAGDALVTRSMTTGRPNGPEILPRSLQNNLPAARDSVQKFKGLGALTLLTGHGRPWTGNMADAVELASRSG